MVTLYHGQSPVGSISGDGDGLEFHYDQAWIKRPSAYPISTSMPLAESPYGREQLIPWLANLLPESHLNEIGQQLKVSPQDVLGLVTHMGRDTAGAVSIGAPRPAVNKTIEISGSDDLERILKELPEKPFLVGQRGVSMSLAGVQEKLPVYIDPEAILNDPDGRDLPIGIPVDGTPSTHIIKPCAPGGRLSAMVQNEAFCMRLAAACGLDVARVTTGQAGSVPYLLVERYDRVLDNDGEVQRIHQEDFCQILGVMPTRKYEHAGGGETTGVGLSAMFGAINQVAGPADRARLLDGLIINVLLCNTDAHAKNYSIIIGRRGRARLAPLYDLLCASVYPEVDQQLAQSVNGRTNANLINGKDWQAVARANGMSQAGVVRRVAELAELVLEHADPVAADVQAMPAGGHQLLDQACHEVKKRARRILRQLENATELDKDQPDELSSSEPASNFS